MNNTHTVQYVFREVSSIDPSRGLETTEEKHPFLGELVIVVHCHGCGMIHYVPTVTFSLDFVCSYCGAKFNLIVSKPENPDSPKGSITWVMR